MRRCRTGAARAGRRGSMFKCRRKPAETVERRGRPAPRDCIPNSKLLTQTFENRTLPRTSVDLRKILCFVPVLLMKLLNEHSFANIAVLCVHDWGQIKR